MSLPSQFVARGELEPQLQITLQNMWEELVLAINSAGDFNTTQKTVDGSTSGSAVFSQTIQNGSYKKVVIYLAALNGTAAFVFPRAFQFTPQILSQSLAARVTTLSVSGVTVTGLPSTGFIELTGY